METRSGAASAQGIRESNQDSHCAFDRHNVFAVADGMGGLSDGERVARHAIDAITRRSDSLGALANKTASPDAAEATLGRRQLFEAIEAVFSRTGIEVFDMGKQAGTKMGTTLTAAVLGGSSVTIGHIGDTRAYRVRGASVELLTNDHSLAAMRYRRGTLTLEEYYRSPMRNILYEFIGHDPELTVDVSEIDVQPGDRLVLCSDGVWDFLDNRRLAMVAAKDDPQEAADQFVRYALRKGSRDNCTCVVVQVRNIGAQRVSLAEVLSQSHLFARLDPRDLTLLAPFMTVRHVVAGDPIIREGDVGDELFIVARGTVEVRRKGIALVQLPETSHFGELALACHMPRSASVVALSDASLLVLSTEGLNELATKRPDLASRVLQRVLAWVGHRLIDMTERAVRAEEKLTRS